MFADNTGVFEQRDQFLEFVETRTSEDGTDLGLWLDQLFQVLNTPECERPSSLDENLARFPYVNGGLFEGRLEQTFSFDASMRKMFLKACYFDWSDISPAIFGSLFQYVMDSEERRKKGAHYTTEQNILKVIEPLFMDDLRDEFNKIKSHNVRRRTNSLRQFQEKLGSLKFFDPACGCGNFLIIAYRELRLLEIEVLKEIYPRTEDGRQTHAFTTKLSCIDVDQFFGIEIGEFPARIAETALWMMDHIMNNMLSLEFGWNFARIPLQKSPNIIRDDALEVDWSQLLHSKDCSYVFGNPPFIGAKLQSENQRSQVQRIAMLGRGGGTLDYVSAWFIKAGKYTRGSTSRIGFVATNSITQGEQVAQLWPILFENCKLEISFAHRTFEWGSDAGKKANVHIVIIGLDNRNLAPANKRVFNYPDKNGTPEETSHTVLSPYLFDASKLSDPHLVVKESRNPINGLNRLIMGSKPIDGGKYIFDNKERADFLNEEPKAIKWLQPFIGAREFLQGEERWILALHNAPPNELAQMPKVRERIAAVRQYRMVSKSKSTRELAKTPTIYHINVIPNESFLVIPCVTTTKREYAPIGWIEPPNIPSNSVLILKNASLTDFALLSSAMHMAWLRNIGGRLGNSYRYSIGVVYNTFPLPHSSTNLSKLIPFAQAVLYARTEYPDSTLDNLYNIDQMPSKLLIAHQSLDRAVDRLYRRKGFQSEIERIEYLFKLYEELCNPL